MISNTFSIASSGLRAAQLGLDVTSHNVANVNTPFYVRENLNLQEQRFQPLPLYPGSGVQATVEKATGYDLNRVGDIIANKANANEAGILNDKLYNALSNSKLPNTLNDIYNAFADLSANPSSLTARQVVIEKTEQLKTQTNQLNNTISEINDDIAFNNNIDVNKFNELLNSLSKANEAGMDDIPKRADLLNQLNEIASVQTNDNGKTIFLKNKNGGLTPILQGNSKTDVTKEQLENALSGRVSARKEFQTNTMPGVLTDVDKVLDKALNNLNDWHKQGYDLNGNPGKDLFNIGNGNFTITTTGLSKEEIAASSTPTTPTNGNNANAIFEKGANDLRSVNDAVGVALAKLGTLISNSNSLAEGYQTGYDNALRDWNNKYGVNLDEEAVNTMKYQRMYEANAKVLQVADSMIGTLLSIKA